MKIHEIENAKQIATITKKDNSENLKVEYSKERGKDKKILALVDSKGEIKNIIERKNEKPFIETGGKGGKPSESSIALNKCCEKEIEDSGEMTLYEIPYSDKIKDKNDVLNIIKQTDGRCPEWNFQANNEKIPKEIKKLK